MASSSTDKSAAVIPLYRPDTDEELVASLRAGHAGAGGALFDAYGPYVRKVLMRVIGPDPELGDLAQDVFVAALTCVHKLESPKALRGWLAQIAVFHARHCLRRRKQWRILRFFGPEDLPAGRAVAHDFEASEALRAVYRILSSLGADEQIAFALRFVEGMELTEVAAACGVSLATVKRRLAKAESRFVDLARLEAPLAEWMGGRR